MSQLKKNMKRNEIIRLIKKHTNGAADTRKLEGIVNDLGLFSLMSLKELSLGELNEIHCYLLYTYENTGVNPPFC